MTTIGSICSGVGALDMAVAAHYHATVAWHAELEPAAATVLAHRYPNIPNIGDLTTNEWPAVDIVCGGFPCQPASTAGRRKGTKDARWIWPQIAYRIGRMDPLPRLLVLENVPGLLTVNGGSAYRDILHSLTAMGYDASWGVVRASDAGAPHRRARWFCVARHTTSTGLEGLGEHAGQRVPAGAGGAAAHPGSARTGRHGGTAPAQEEPGGRGEPHAADQSHLHLGVAAHAERIGPQGQHQPSLGQDVGEEGHEPARSTATPERWGKYAPAIARWERITGRPAPDPTDTDRGRLSARFSEWMMGLPDGWVTGPDIYRPGVDPRPLLSRTAALRCIGNSVVPHQAALALTLIERNLP